MREKGDDEEKQRKKKLKFDDVLKRYVRLVRPPYSFSGILSTLRTKDDGLGENSAATSVRTSPRNSGNLVATDNVSSSIGDSTMEELQVAIQAAVAHCKNS